MTLVDRICRDSYPVWDKCLETPFINEICAGTISDDKVLKYIIEDTIYLKEYAKCFAYAITKCDTFEQIRYFYNILNFVNEKETSVRRTFIKNHNLTDDEVERRTPDDACKEYTEFLVTTARDGSLKELLVAILPCMLSYQYIFERALKKYPDILKTKYADILEYYVDPNYKVICKRWIDYANDLCKDITEAEEVHLTKIFRKSSELELDFWIMSYENEIKKEIIIMKEKFSIRVMAEIAIFAALSYALNMLQSGLFRAVWINGGSIGIAMVPVFIIAYRRGLGPGLLCGLIVSLLNMLPVPYVISGRTYEGAMKFFAPFFQLSLDYILGYTVVGLAGAWSGMFKKSESFKGRAIAIVIGTVVAGMLKFTMHVLAGGFFWLDPSIEFLGVNGGSWLYTLVYNATYSIPNVVICTAVMLVIAKIYPQFIDTKLIKKENDIVADDDIEKDEETEAAQEVEEA